MFLQIFAGEGKRYDEHIAELGGINLQLLGIGLDGHIGFNEPNTYFVKSTHVVDLHESTIKANSRLDSSAPPRYYRDIQRKLNLTCYYRRKGLSLTSRLL